MSTWPEITRAVLIGHNLNVDPMAVLRGDEADFEVWDALSDAAVALSKRIAAENKT